MLDVVTEELKKNKQNKTLLSGICMEYTWNWLEVKDFYLMGCLLLSFYSSEVWIIQTQVKFESSKKDMSQWEF